MKLKFAFALALLVGHVGSSDSRAAAPNEEPLTTIAALPFTEASANGRHAPLAEAIGDILMVRLSNAEGVAFVERAAIKDVLKELELSAVIGAADQSRLGRALGAQFVLTGSLTSSGDKFQLAAHLLEVSTTRVARSAKITARADDLVESIDKLAVDLVGQLRRKLPELTQTQIDQSPDANLHFMRGLGYFYAGMHEHAATQFLKTTAIDPDHAEARFFRGLNYFDGAEEYGHAKIEFTRFLREFSNHHLAGRAKEKLQQCETRLGNLSEGRQP